MKSALLVVLLAAAATAAVISKDVPEEADVDVYEMPDVFVTNEDELIEADELTDEVQTAIESRRNLNQGSIGNRDVRLLNSEIRVTGVSGRVLERTIRVSSSNRRISAVRVNRVGASQNATPAIIAGGIGSSSVTIRIRSAVGRGFHYRVQVYGR